MPTRWKPSSRPQALACAASPAGSMLTGIAAFRGVRDAASIMRDMHDPSGAVSTAAAIYTAEQVRGLDRRAIEEFGIPGYELMTRAGHATLNALKALWPAARSITVLCGPGNNGGDGYVVARLARAQSMRVTVVALGDPRALTGDARAGLRGFRRGGRALGAVVRGSPRLRRDRGCALRHRAHSRRRRRGGGDDRGRECIAAGRSSRWTSRPGCTPIPVPCSAWRFAPRSPSLSSAASSAATSARVPITSARLVLDELDVPSETYAGTEPVARLLGDETPLRALPRRSRAAHKGANGHVLVIGGGPGMPGAVRLAGEAALRAGAGLVTVAVHPRERRRSSRRVRS